MTPLEILKGARELISIRAHWTTGTHARDKYGESVDSHSTAAVCWCAQGAVEKIGHRFATPSVWDALRRASVPRGSIAYMNDRLGHAATLSMFDQAIANVEET